MIRGLVYDREDNDGEQWAPVADLMAALMLIFMFIAILYIYTLVSAKDNSRYECQKIYKILESEFRAEFIAWNVELLEDLTIRFRNPDILFELGKSIIRPQLENILQDFFPRYMNAIIPYRDDVREIRIEGHTSSEFGLSSGDEAYIRNMELSQQRAYEILQFVLGLPEARLYSDWAKPHITANGLSSSHLLNGKSRLLSNAGGNEDKNLSRRIEFRLLTSSCQRAGIDHRAQESLVYEN